METIVRLDFEALDIGAMRDLTSRVSSLCGEDYNVVEDDRPPHHAIDYETVNVGIGAVSAICAFITLIISLHKARDRDGKGQSEDVLEKAYRQLQTRVDWRSSRILRESTDHVKVNHEAQEVRLEIVEERLEFRAYWNEQIYIHCRIKEDC